MSSDRVNRGHFVPQGYLEAFADPTRPGQIFVLLKANPGTTYANPIAKVASRTGFYDAEPGDTEQVIEHWFGDEIESLLPHQIAEFVRLGRRQHVGHLPADLLDQLLIHVSLQFLRTDQAREAIKERLITVHKWPGGAIDAIMESMKELPGLVSVELGQVEVVMNGPAHAELLMNDRNVNGMLADLRTFTWQLHTTEAATPFVTSDAPVLVQKAKALVPIQGFPEGTVICYPLTPMALLFGQKVGRIPRAKRPPHLVRVGPDRVAAFNHAMFRGAHVQLLGSSREILLAAAIGGANPAKDWTADRVVLS